LKLLDTSVAIDFLRRHQPAVEAVRSAAESDLIGASEVTRFELLVGVHPAEEEATEAFFSQLTWIPVEESIARSAAALARRYRAAYSGIEDADYLIAATAIELEADFVTTNVRHFPMLAGLEPAY
jgi:predicted nucleic acid-binding protein